MRLSGVRQGGALTSRHAPAPAYLGYMRRSSAPLRCSSRGGIVGPSSGGSSTQTVQVAGASGATSKGDPFKTAGMRLQRLVDDASWDGGEAMRQELLELPIASRLTFFINISCIPLSFAIILNFVTNEELFGGMSLSHDSLVHALHGIGYALPLLATSLLGRIPRVRRAFPVLENLHEHQEKVMEPMVSGLDAPQLLIVCLTATLPCLLFMLPAVHGSTLVLGSLLQQDVLSPAGVHIPGSVGQELSVLMPAMISSWVAAFIVAKQLTLRRSQYRAIQEAISNSDRYYRLTESTFETAQNGDTAERSREVSEAFKLVSTIWVASRKKVAQLSFILTALNVCYFAMIWHDTNDLSTPFACALLSFGFEMLLSRRSLLVKERARKRLREEYEQRRA